MKVNAVHRIIQQNKAFTIFLKIFLDFAYFVCLSPFRFKLESSRELGGVPRYISSKWLPQTCACSIFAFFGIFWQIQGIRTGLQSSSNPTDPSGYFILAQKFVGCSGEFLAAKILWYNRLDLVKILNLILEERTPLTSTGIRGRQHKLLLTMVAFIVCAMYTGITALDFITQRAIGKTAASGNQIFSNLTLEIWWEKMVETGRFNFGIVEHVQDPIQNGSPSNVYTQGMETFMIGLFSAIGFLHRRFNGSFVDLFLLMAGLTFWIKAKQFATFVRNFDSNVIENSAKILPKNCIVQIDKSYSVILNDNHYQKWRLIYLEYKSIRSLTDLINTLMGNMVTCVLLSGILEYAVSLDVLFSETSWRDWTKFLGVTFYVCYTAAFLYFSADACYQMTTLKSWLFDEEHQLNIPSNQFYSIINELDTNRVAIKGSGVYSVTYSLVASMIGITVTYFIICVQA